MCVCGPWLRCRLSQWRRGGPGRPANAELCAAATQRPSLPHWLLLQPGRSPTLPLPSPQRPLSLGQLPALQWLAHQRLGQLFGLGCQRQHSDQHRQSPRPPRGATTPTATMTRPGPDDWRLRPERQRRGVGIEALTGRRGRPSLSPERRSASVFFYSSIMVSLKVPFYSLSHTWLQLTGSQLFDLSHNIIRCQIQTHCKKTWLYHLASIAFPLKSMNIFQKTDKPGKLRRSQDIMILN